MNQLTNKTSNEHYISDLYETVFDEYPKDFVGYKKKIDGSNYSPGVKAKNRT